MPFYGKVEDAKIRSGIEFAELGFDTESEFDTYVEGLLVKAKEYIDFYTNNEFSVDPVERSVMVDDIAERIASRMLNIAVRDQTNQYIEVNDFNAQLVDDVVVTKGIKADLELLPTGNAKDSTRGTIYTGVVTDQDDFDFYVDAD
jgi:hypothetical protein